MYLKLKCRSSDNSVIFSPSHYCGGTLICSFFAALLLPIKVCKSADLQTESRAGPGHFIQLEICALTRPLHTIHTVSHI